MPYDEPVLLKQIAGGNTTAFGEVFEHYHRRCLSYAFKIMDSTESAEDIVQEVFLNLWSIRERLPSINNLNSYLHRMVHNQACAELERSSREELVMHALKSGSLATEETGSLLLAREVREHIHQLVDSLSPRQREIFLLSREQGLKYEEIAARLNISFQTVKTHLRDTLKLLREGLKDHFGEQALLIIVIWQLGNL
ncbi:MAG TPA: RNA polymerase sigma-70 factor [Chitinophagaceae bacterium]|nr:RNA polymerase sigma-70 factor [Chitinophagaceae bacterium]